MKRGFHLLVLLLFLPIGIAIGVLGGFFGLGGGILLTPVLLLLGVSPVEAITTGLLFSIGTSISSVWGHLKLNNIIWKAAIPIGVSGIVGTQLARPLVMYFEKIGIGETVLSTLYLVILLYFAISMILPGKKNEGRLSKSDTFSMPLLIIVGLVGGFLSSSLGVGGGFIVVPLLVSFANFPAKQAVGTSAVCIFLFVTAGFSSYIMHVEIDLLLGLFLIIGALIGGQLGAKTTVHFANKEMRKMLGILYAVTWFSLLLKLFKLEVVGFIILASYTSYLLTVFVVRTMKGKKKLEQN
jgi:uncharacterized protein